MLNQINDEQVREAMLHLLRPKGKWVEKNFGIVCSECNAQAYHNPLGHQVRTIFCPTCGADMRGLND